MNELDFVARYGPIGLLAILMMGGGRIGLKVVDRLYGFLDKLEVMVDAVTKTMLANETSAEKRHLETRIFISDTAKETRHEIRGELGKLALGLEAHFRRLGSVPQKSRRSEADPED